MKLKILLTGLIFIFPYLGCTPTANKEDLDKIDLRISLLELQLNPYKTAYLTPGTDNYDIIDAGIGRLTISLDNVQPFANGSKVTLKIGNPTSATIDGVEADLEWGTVDKTGIPVNDTAKVKHVTFNEVLRAGAWTNVSCVLENTLPTELGFIRVKELSHSSIKLQIK